MWQGGFDSLQFIDHGEGGSGLDQGHGSSHGPSHGPTHSHGPNNGPNNGPSNGHGLIHGPIHGPVPINGFKQPNIPNSTNVWNAPFPLGPNTGVAFAAAAEMDNQIRQSVAVAKSWIPASLSHVRHYFAVSHSSVAKKLTAHFVPPLGYRWVWSSATGRQIRSGDDSPSRYSRSNIGVDLYIPLMAFITYVLLFGLARAIHDRDAVFHPEVLTRVASLSLLGICLEALFVGGCCWVLQRRVILCEIVAISALKFVSLAPVVGAVVFFGKNSIGYWLIYAYLSLCAAHAEQRSLTAATLKDVGYYEQNNSSGMSYVIWAVSLAQIPLCWLFSP